MPFLIFLFTLSSFPTTPSLLPPVPSSQVLSSLVLVFLLPPSLSVIHSWVGDGSALGTGSQGRGTGSWGAQAHAVFIPLWLRYIALGPEGGGSQTNPKSL